MSEIVRSRRAFANGSVDGDDVWPQDLTDSELAVIAALDRRIESQEGDELRGVADKIGGGPVYSVAERIRHWRDLIGDLDRGAAVSAGVYGTELRCRSLINQHLAEMPVQLSNRLMREVVAPLDVRFDALTIDDAGSELAKQTHIGDDFDGEWWWLRRPAVLPEEWDA